MAKLLHRDDIIWLPLKSVLVRTKGTKITAGQMKVLHKDGAPVKIFAGGKTVAFVDYDDIPEKDINTKPSIIVKSRGNIEFEYYDQPFSHKNEMWSYHSNEKSINIKYLYHYLKMNQSYFQGIGSKMQMPQIATPDTDNFQVPIPCPENPEKSLQIQAEIVRILDAFTSLTAELTAELSARKQQYSHYQFELLQFTEATQHLKIGECCDIKKGLTPIKKATPGKYPLVATTQERQSSSEYQFDCAAVCVPLISSRGHGVASIDRIYFQEGKFALGNILCAIIPNDSQVLSAKFLRYYLFDKKDVLLVPLMRGGANVSLTVDSLKKVKIPIPPIADQERIVRILDKFDELVKGLPREIELRQKQYEYYRDLLLSFPKPDEQAA
ncbi:restriction endonuclease subunit S [Aliidiomarina iranensis]|uniref:Restriction endonuclease subunit S n=2 Tax=Aliidiomarina iranensis TaxID=1434071 RepID=A0A432VWP6_9GAMM|nr:restriction endonuclease subunit S [Aliidiomarina iranensis]